MSSDWGMTTPSALANDDAAGFASSSLRWRERLSPFPDLDGQLAAGQTGRVSEVKNCVGHGGLRSQEKVGQDSIHWVGAEAGDPRS